MKPPVYQADETLDARAMDCPMPLLKTKQRLAKMDSGQRLYVVATDAGSKKDFAAYARISGNRLLEHAEQAMEFHYLFVKA